MKFRTLSFAAFATLISLTFTMFASAETAPKDHYIYTDVVPSYEEELIRSLNNHWDEIGGPTMHLGIGEDFPPFVSLDTSSGDPELDCKAFGVLCRNIPSWNENDLDVFVDIDMSKLQGKDKTGEWSWRKALPLDYGTYDIHFTPPLNPRQRFRERLCFRESAEESKNFYILPIPSYQKQLSGLPCNEGQIRANIATRRPTELELLKKQRPWKSLEQGLLTEIVPTELTTSESEPDQKINERIKNVVKKIQPSASWVFNEPRAHVSRGIVRVTLTESSKFDPDLILKKHDFKPLVASGTFLAADFCGLDLLNLAEDKRVAAISILFPVTPELPEKEFPQ